MKKLLTIIALFAVIMAQAKDYKYESVANDPMGVRIYTLDNGLKVYLSVNKEKPRVTAHIAVNTGSRNDPAEYTGLAHYLEHLVFKGSRQFGTTDYTAEKPYIDKIRELYEEYRTLTDPIQRKAKYHEIDSVSQIAARYNIPNEYDKLMTLVGGTGSNAYTSFDITCYTEDIPANELDRWARIQADRFQNLVLRGFHTELEAVYEEKNISMASDSEKAFDAFMLNLFPTHSYGTQTTIGTQEHLKNPSLVAIQNYYDRYYVPNNVAIVMAGDFNPDHTIAMLDKHFGSWKRGDNTAPRYFEKQPTFTSPQEAFVVGQEQENVMLGWRFEGAASLQNDTLQIVGNILRNGKAGLVDLNINQKMTMQDAGVGLYGLKDYSILFFEGVPNEGQSLSDVRKLLLAEVDNLKRGNFDDNLITSITNNEKLNYLRRLDYNDSRVYMMVDAFINNEPWAQHVAQIERMSKITKADVMAFANKYLTDGYAYVEKRKGEDTSVKKIEKPAITPIPANREYTSKFLKNMAEETVEPIQPEFVDFEKELTFSNIKSLPLIYKQNKENDLYSLQLRYEFGSEADNRYNVAADYLKLLGTKLMSAEDIQKKFYNLASNFGIHVSGKYLYVYLNGLQENMPEAMKLVEEVMQNAVADKALYAQYVDMELKSRAESKNYQESGFYRLWEYALHGERNSYTNKMTESELKSTSPDTYTSLIKELKNMKHTVLYYGPATEKELAKIVSSVHKVPKKLADVPQNKPYEWTKTPQAEVLIAPYEAKNIYLRMLNQEGQHFDKEQLPLVTLFNEYFGGGMNTIVFQELRETRGLAYNAGAYFHMAQRKEEPNYTMLHIISQNDKMMDCINVFRDIVDNLPANENSLSIAKENLMKTIAASRTTKFNIISTYVNRKSQGIDYDANKLIYENLPKITMQDLVNFEKENIARKPMRYIIFGDEKELDMKALEKIGPIKRLSLDDIFEH